MTTTTPPPPRQGATIQDPTVAGRHDNHRNVTNRLKTARGHLDGIIRMVEDDTWCPDIMKQLAAVQGMLESTSREVFRHHLEGHVADAIRAGRGEQIVDELMETLKYDKRVLRPVPTAHGPTPEHAPDSQTLQEPWR